MAETEILIYSITYPIRMAEGDFQYLLELLPGGLRGAMAQKIGQYRRWEDAHGSLLGKVLLMKALAEAGLVTTLDRLQYNEWGRPYLEGAPDFNISHSGNRVVCVVSPTGRVGIDLEEIRSLFIDDFMGQFAEAEWAAIQGAEEPLRVFYQYWTAKEALIKADGRGLNVPLDEVVIGETGKCMLGDRYWALRRVDAWEGYGCHVAGEGSFEIRIKEVGVREIFDF